MTAFAPLLQAFFTDRLITLTALTEIPRFCSSNSGEFR